MQRNFAGLSKIHSQSNDTLSLVSSGDQSPASQRERQFPSSFFHTISFSFDWSYIFGVNTCQKMKLYRMILQLNFKATHISCSHSGFFLALLPVATEVTISISHFTTDKLTNPWHHQEAQTCFHQNPAHADYWSLWQFASALILFNFSPWVRTEAIHLSVVLGKKKQKRKHKKPLQSILLDILNQMKFCLENKLPSLQH